MSTISLSVHAVVVVVYPPDHGSDTLNLPEHGSVTAQSNALPTELTGQGIYYVVGHNDIVHNVVSLT